MLFFLVQLNINISDRLQLGILKNIFKPKKEKEKFENFLEIQCSYKINRMKITCNCFGQGELTIIIEINKITQFFTNLQCNDFICMSI